MEIRSLVLLALKTLHCTQKELAEKLNVSPTQISKWKKGEHVSFEMMNKIKEITKIGDLDPDLVAWSGSLEEAKKWNEIINFLAQDAIDNNETGFDCDILNDEDGTLCGSIVRTLSEMGISPPESFPSNINIDYLMTDDKFEEQEIQYTLLSENKYTSIIFEILNSLTSVYGFYAAFIYDIFWDEELDLFNTEAIEIEYNLVSLAACKSIEDCNFCPNYKEFRYDTLNKYNKWISFIKEKAIRARIPLKAELLNIVYKTKDELDVETEHEALGFNKSRLHPDIYMNEVLEGIRTLHQVLPAILKKLEIYDDFKLDQSSLHL